MNGCIREEPAPALSESVEALQTRDSAEMAGLYAEWAKTHPGGDAMPLDFSNDVHYRVIHNRLAAAGKTVDNSPELFARLAGARLKAQHARHAGLADTPPAEPWCGQEIPYNKTRTGQYSARSMFGCRNNEGYSFADVTAYATTVAFTDFIFLRSTSIEGFAARHIATGPVAGRSTPSPGRLLFMDSITLAFDETTDNDFSGYQPAVAFNAVPDRDQTLPVEHPREIQGNAPDNPIRLCLYREHIHVGPNQDCDYGTVKYVPEEGFYPYHPEADGMAAAVPTAANTPWTADANAYFPSVGPIVPQNGNPVLAYIPMRGTYDAGAANTRDCSNPITRGTAQLFLLETGGSCKGVPVDGELTGEVDLPWRTHDPREALWTFSGLVDFGQTCLHNLQNAKLTIRITNDNGTCGPGRGVTKEISPIDFRNSCLAEGTLVATSSGRSVAVEKLAIGDKVVADRKGRALTIQAISRGFEPGLMVRLLDERGRRVMVTDTHPMVLASGSVVAASKLVAGDKVLTRQGATKLVTVDRVKHSGKVFNFVLGTKEEIASVPPSERTMFANGFLVGDSVMQRTLEDSLRARPLVASRVGRAWLEDYKSAVIRKTVAEP